MIIKKENLQPIVPSGQNWNFEFNPITRELKIVTLPTIIAGDNNSNVIFIKTPLEYNGVDLLGVNCIINYSTNWTINDKKNQGQVDLTNSCTEFNEYLIYTWVLDSKQTLRTGMCNFSMEFIMNLEEDPYQNQTKYYLTKNTDENQNDYLQISKTNINDIQKKYWSISSLKATLFIDEGGEQISGDGEIYPEIEIVDSVGRFTAEGGEIFNDYENNQAISEYSHSEGSYTVANGEASHAEGYESVASGNYSHAEGQGTIAFCEVSHSEGRDTKAGTKSFNITDYNIANNTYTLDSVEGLKKDDIFSVKWINSYINYGTITDIDANNLIITVSNLARPKAEDEDKTDEEIDAVENKHLFIIENPAIGTTPFDIGQHAEGVNTKAILYGSHAEGYNTVAADRYAHTEGSDNIAYYSAHAEGKNNKALGNMSHAEGANNEALGGGSHAEGISTHATAKDSHTEGTNTWAINEHAHAEGSATRATGSAAHSEGVNTEASGFGAHAEGGYAINSETKELLKTTASGQFSHAEGRNTKASAQCAHSEGIDTTASAQCSHAEGYNTTAKGENSHTGGNVTQASGKNSFAHGLNLRASQPNQFVIGKHNLNRTDTVFEVGNGKSWDPSTWINAFQVHDDGHAEVQTMGDNPNDNTVATKGYVDQLKPKKVLFTNGATITAEDNTSYYASGKISSLTIIYPNTDFICSFDFTIASEGDVTITLPESKYIGGTPSFANGETWEVNIKNGVVVGGLVE